jgi:hypothetical protein
MCRKFTRASSDFLEQLYEFQIVFQSSFCIYLGLKKHANLVIFFFRNRRWWRKLQKINFNRHLEFFEKLSPTKFESFWHMAPNKFQFQFLYLCITGLQRISNLKYTKD